MEHEQIQSTECSDVAPPNHQGWGRASDRNHRSDISTRRFSFCRLPGTSDQNRCGHTPGGPSDLVGRIIAASLDQSTRTTFIVENRGGAGCNIGMGYVARATPDGYTILLATNGFSVNV